MSFFYRTQDRIKRRSIYNFFSSFKSYLSDSNLDGLLCELEGSDNSPILPSRSLDTLLKAKLDDDISQYSNVEDTTKSMSERARMLFNLTKEDIGKIKSQKERKSSEKWESMDEKVISSVLFNETADVEIGV